MRRFFEKIKIESQNKIKSLKLFTKKQSDRPLVSLGNFEMQQSIDLPITDKNFLTLSGSLHSENAHPNHGDSDSVNGSVSATLRRLLASDAYLDVKIFLSDVLYTI